MPRIEWIGTRSGDLARGVLVTELARDFRLVRPADPPNLKHGAHRL